MTGTWTSLGYLLAAVCFIVALKGLSSPKSARTGNAVGAAGALVAMLVVILAERPDRSNASSPRCATSLSTAATTPPTTLRNRRSPATSAGLTATPPPNAATPSTPRSADPITYPTLRDAALERRGWAIQRIRAAAYRDTVDHMYLFIGPGGVFVVEHQAWTVMDTIIRNPQTGRLHIGRLPAIRRTTSVRATAAAVVEALSDASPVGHSVHALLAVDGKTLTEIHVVGDVTIVPGADLGRFLRRADPVLNEPDIATVSAVASQLF